MLVLMLRLLNFGVIFCSMVRDVAQVLSLAGGYLSMLRQVVVYHHLLVQLIVSPTR